MNRWLGVWMLTALAAAAAQAARPAVTEIALRPVPQELRVRPGETLVIQARVYGEVTGDDGRALKVRLRQAGAAWSVKPADAAWLSKPFRFQGEADEPFYAADAASVVDLIFDRVTEAYVLQDCVLFTAGPRGGDVTVSAELAGKRAALTIRVAADAPSRRPAETVSFAAEGKPADPYLPLAERYAPFVAQETWFHPKADYLARFDFDRDWAGDDNWANTDRGSSQAYVHYAVMETETHWYLIYNLFHPRDYSDKCVAGTCHENDNEGLILTVAKDGTRWGRLLAMETLAHNNVYSYRADSRVGPGAHDLDGEVALTPDRRPRVFVEAGGHGIYGVGDARARFDAAADRFSAGTGVTYVYKGKAERPRHANDRQVGYALLAIREQWWARAGEAGRMFADYFAYQPLGGRPGLPGRQIPKAFRGRELGANMAKPFWGWHDERTRKKKVLATGQWALDPAYGVSRNLSLPAPHALDYIHNPYLGFDRVGQAPEREDPAGGDAAAGEVVFAARRIAGAPPRFDIRMEADDVVEVTVQGDRVNCRAVSGRPAADRGTECTAPLPGGPVDAFRLDKLDGRGDVRLVESPGEANGFAARLRIEDPKKGSARYHLRLTWAEPEPPAGESPGDPAAPAEGGALPGLPLPAPEGGEPSAGRDEGYFDFQARVDGTVELWVRGHQVNVAVESGQFVRQSRYTLSQPLPRRACAFELRRWDGRGEVRLVEEPTAANGWTARIRLSDPAAGDALYRFTLSWRASP